MCCNECLSIYRCFQEITLHCLSFLTLIPMLIDLVFRFHGLSFLSFMSHSLFIKPPPLINLYQLHSTSHVFFCLPHLSILSHYFIKVNLLTAEAFDIQLRLDHNDISGAASTGLSCPKNYRYFGGNCYRYYPWVNRHYRPGDYRFQETWHKALRQCERENATLASIHSEEEAYFLKVR